MPVDSPLRSKAFAPTIAVLAFSASAVLSMPSDGDTPAGARRQTESRTGLLENKEVRIERITP